MQVALGEKMRAEDGTEGKVRKIVTLMDNPMVEGFTIANDVIFLEGVDRGYPLWQLTPVEPEKPKERALRRLSAGAYCCMPEPCVHTEESCKTCACLCWPHSYAQRIGMAWGGYWQCRKCGIWVDWIGGGLCQECLQTLRPKPAQPQLMICDHAGECKKVRDPGCSHDKPHESLRWGKTWCTDTHNGFHRCFEDSKCIPYQEERDWFVVYKPSDDDGHVWVWDHEAGYTETQARICASHDPRQRRAFRWSQGVRG